MNERPIASITIGKRHRKDVGDLDGLADSIAAFGLLQPVGVTPGGRLLFGERRLRACLKLGWATIPVVVHDVDPDDMVAVEAAENVSRKNFTASEAVALWRSREPELKAEAERRMKAGKPLESFSKGRAVDKVSVVTGLSRPTIHKAEAIVAAAEAEPEKFAKLVEAMDRSGVDGPYRRLVNMQQAERIRAEPPPLPGRGPYRVIVCDPPWAYEPDDENAAHRGVLPYPTMSIEQVCSTVPVGSIAHTDSILWLWVTNFVVVRGLHLPVLRAWDFQPKTIVTWPKDRSTGQGHYAKGQTEHMVMAVRGKPVVTLTDQSTLLRGPFDLVRKGAHSAKPIQAYTYIERLCPASRYADVFSRYQHSDRWDCHGDQAPTVVAECA